MLSLSEGHWVTAMRRGVRKPFSLAAVVVLAALVAGCTIIGPPPSSHGDSPKTHGFATTPSSNKSARPTPSRSHGHKTNISPFVGLANYLASRQGQITAAVYDNRTGKTWILHRGMRQETASIVKVEIMGTAFWNAEHGQPLSAAQQALLTPMIEQSDNTAATDLLAAVGGPSKVQHFDQLAGLTGTTVSTKQYIPGSTLPGWGLTMTTALDEVKLVRAFAYSNSLLTRANRLRGLALMEHVESAQAWGVSGGNYGVLPGATVALKNGWLPHDLTAYTNWQVNSIGWVHSKSRDYVLAVLTTHNASEQYGIDTIDEIARSIYRQLGS
jgi:beta-lactamase family protein